MVSWLILEQFRFLMLR